MNKLLQYFVIGIAIASIGFALYAWYNGGEFNDALSGIIIGFALLGGVFFKKKQNSNT